MGASEAKEIIAETHRDSLVSLNTYEQADELLATLGWWLFSLCEAGRDWKQLVVRYTP